MNFIMKNLARAICFFSMTALMAQSNDVKTQLYIEQTASQYDLSETDIQDWIITAQHTSNQSGITHIYGTQRYEGIEVDGANFGLHLIDRNKVVAFDNQFKNKLGAKIANGKRGILISSIEATEYAARHLGLEIDEPLKVISPATGNDKTQVISNGKISERPIDVKLTYFPKDDSTIQLTWSISIDEIGFENSWVLMVDAFSGEILQKRNLVLNCTFYDESENDAPNGLKPPSGNKNSSRNSEIINSNSLSNSGGTYNVYPEPVESPNFGTRSLIANPANTIASPYGWHDTNGNPGAEYTITRGNNIHAFDGRIGSTYRTSPDGGSGLIFDYPISFPWTESNRSIDAAITNAFYWNNVMHDVWYQYGFDEASGNFQENNYGNNGLGGDYVDIYIQTGDGPACNAGFATPIDGRNASMSMYVSNCNDSSIFRDGAYDNGVMSHEYGHGISIRLAGGPNNVNTLVTAESAQEGIADYFGTIMTIEPGDQGSDSRSVGTWLLSQSGSGGGARTYPYSTDMSINPDTYGILNTLNQNQSHRIGSVLNAMFWEMIWNLIDHYGYDPDLYEGVGGNNIAMQLVIEAIKLLPQYPGFTDWRDAILQADQVIYSGTNSCLIWTAFAKRGVGLSANKGTYFVNDETEAFDVPGYCSCNEANLIIDDDVQTGWIDFQEAPETIVATNTIFSGGRAEYNAGTSVTMTPGFHAQSGSEFLGYIEGCSGLFGFKNSITYEEIDLSPYGVDTSEELKSLSISPNPNIGRFVLKGSHNMKQWEVSNYMGRVYFTGKMNEKDSTIQQIDIGNLPTGIYFIKVEFQDGEIITKQVIKE